MSIREGFRRTAHAAGLCLVIATLSLAATAAFGQEATIGVYVDAVIDVYGHGPVEFNWVKGPCDILWLPPYPDPFGHIIIDSEMLALDIFGDGIEARRNPGLPSVGQSRSLDPGIDFPAESFFDVFMEVELPGFFPADTLINYEPLHLTGIIGQFPPYYAVYSYPMGNPPIHLFNGAGIDVAAILSWEERILPYYPPEADVYVETAYGSDVALFNEDGLLEVRASLTGIDDAEISYAEFSIRRAGEPGEFVPFYTDFSGEGTRSSTHGPRGEGDGWCGYFDPGSEPFEEHVYEIRVELFSPRHGPRIDTCSIWIDRTPPYPWMLPKREEPDTVSLFQVDSFFDIEYTMEDELPGPCPAELQAFPLSQIFERPLTVVDQLGLGTPLDSVSCGPAAAASCLKYFADNGHPALDNPLGDESKPDASPEEIARELQGAMGTRSPDGTSDAGMVAGIKKFLEGHGATGWDVSSHEVGGAVGLGEMFRELEADGEDVIVLLQDTLTSGENAGDTTGHWVTLGSREQIQHAPDSASQKIDFMDPWGGGSTADNKYDIGADGSGYPTTEGYDLDGGGASARIAGYIKVSPPEGGAGPLRERPAFDPGWIPLDAGMVRGHGLVDTLHWDTAGFMPGLYLLEVVTTNHMGRTCRDLRLCLLVGPSTGDDPETPGVKTGLLGTWPNPFNPATTIAYAVERDGPVTIAIYDVAGRRIRTLLDGVRVEAGSHTITWNGLDERGVRVSSGVYFCRLNARDAESTAKVILLR